MNQLYKITILSFFITCQNSTILHASGVPGTFSFLYNLCTSTRRQDLEQEIDVDMRAAVEQQMELRMELHQALHISRIEFEQRSKRELKEAIRLSQIEEAKTCFERCKTFPEDIQHEILTWFAPEKSPQSAAVTMKGAVSRREFLTQDARGAQKLSHIAKTSHFLTDEEVKTANYILSAGVPAKQYEYYIYKTHALDTYLDPEIRERNYIMAKSYKDMLNISDEIFTVYRMGTIIALPAETTQARKNRMTEEYYTKFPSLRCLNK